MKKMVVFDLDGTLLDTLGDLADAGNFALAEQGFPVHETVKYKYFVGNGIPKLIERILPEETAEQVRKETYDLFCSYYNNHMNDKTRPYKGACELLRKLKEKGVLVRHFDKQRLTEYNRITIGSREQMETLVEKIDEILEEVK